MKIKNILIVVLLTLGASSVLAQTDTTIYNLTIRQETVNKAGKETMGMTVNGSIPGPTIRFEEGDYAVIYVKNEMDVETSVHWHGLLLPNFYDGVPYLTTPPIEPGQTQKYEFPLIQSGTYWYHSHTMLQEQSGVYGSIIIDPKEGETLDYDKELVMVLSDWTNQKPRNVLRNLKRGNEWYNIKKGTATPLNQVIARGAFGAQLNFWRQRMESADIADIYYPAFLNNGEEVQEYPQFEPGEKVRLRIINGAASSQFWMTFGGEAPLLVAADGLNVVPVRRNKTFIGIAETYDFIVTIPNEGKIEFRAMAQDGSGHSQAYLGKGKILAAPVVERPDKIKMMQQMAKMNMRMGAPAMKFNPSNEEPDEMMNNWGMQMDSDMKMEGMDHSKMNHGMNNQQETQMEGIKQNMDHSQMGHEQDMEMKVSKSEDQMASMNMFSEYNYDYLKAPASTVIDDNQPVRNILLNLTGNMWRYIWSMNGVPLSEADIIKISKGEKVRITFNNLTMMHHPMHLHGHFFRVINKHGDYSPLKHTVNVPPMQKTVIEFDASEDSDWFLHCHVLYHMIGGMARAVSYGTERDPRLKKHPAKILFGEGNHFYSWGMADIASHMTEINLVSSNIRNQFNLNAEVGYNENIEAEFTYERYLYDYFRVFAGVNVENEIENSLDDLSVTAIAGIRFFTPYMFNLDVRMDNKLRPEIRVSREIMIFPRTAIFGNYEYQADFGLVNNLTEEGSDESVDYKGETTWSAGLEYFLSRNFSLMASYDNRFGAGGGLSVRF
uniref:Multicopper oxidase domain-containing protein n=1 Tax=Roseihalotalea indica TaxID=2867963 RepID=A0AA49GNM5_9BACT|nr:multicopper oxidase domain-containing protein [Tunicatimonas sp. TK19036]